MRASSRSSLIGTGILIVVGVCAATRPLDRAAWHADADALATQMASAYANFEWSVSSGRVNASSLLAETHAAIDKATSERRARRAVQSMLDAFHDPHVRMGDRVSWAATPASSPTGASGQSIVSIDRSASSACKAFGYGSRDRDFNHALKSLASYRVVRAGRYFRTALARDDKGKRLGLLRLPHTSQDGWRSACEQSWPTVSARFPRGCADACKDALWVATGDTLLADLANALRMLTDSAASTLVVDLTGNGGGSEWADGVARTLGSPGLLANPTGMVRHPHWERSLSRELAGLDSVLASTALTPSARAWTMTERARVDSLRREVARACDYAVVWRGERPSCSPLVVYAARTVSPDSLRAWRVPTFVSRSRYAYEPGTWRGPVVLVTDKRTGSAAEQLVSVLVDNAGAHSAGERTAGAGCGFTYGGIRFALPNSRHEVRLPDCARLRKSGENERAGVGPTLSPAWSAGDGRSVRGAKLRQALASM